MTVNAAIDIMFVRGYCYVICCCNLFYQSVYIVLLWWFGWFKECWWFL